MRGSCIKRRAPQPSALQNNMDEERLTTVKVKVTRVGQGQGQLLKPGQGRRQGERREFDVLQTT
jgi:hypothetical protein